MFVPTPRLLAIGIAGVVPVAVAGTVGQSFSIGAIWVAAVILAGLTDGFMTPRAAQLVWRRTHEPKLYIGVWNSMELSLHNRSAKVARFRVRDVTPQLIRPRHNVQDGLCGPGSRTAIRYSVYPVHRGRYAIGPVVARLKGPLGLAWRQRHWPVAEDVDVYPNLLPMRSYEALARLGRLEELGLRNARRFGGGTEFDQLREYSPDDDYRHISWKATARAQKFMAVEYRTERSQNVIFALDAGRLMNVPVRQDPTTNEPSADALTRFDHSLNAALLLAFVAEKTGDRVGVVVFSDRIMRRLPPRGGRRSLLSVIAAVHDLEAEPVEPDYRLGLAYLAATLPKRSLIVLFTDFMESESATGLLDPVRTMARRHLCLVATLRDPDLEALAVREPESAEELYERAVAQRVLDERAATIAGLARAGVLTLDVSPNRLSPEVVNRYLEIKARRML